MVANTIIGKAKPILKLMDIFSFKIKMVEPFRKISEIINL